ncbi:MAG: type III-B CRISPR module RAMP protein Cmr6 [Deinococcota bacterium]|nr:type III-B CRISPR module RAMP protein Cmr6 [Deinococcota bacterium]
MRPLYKEAAQNVARKGGHAGLWYDKFCDEWQGDWTGLGDEGKKRWVETVTSGAVGEREQLKEHAERLAKLLSACGQTPLPYQLTSDFVTGLGREHPVENGFAWHQTLATPYLPGSSVKGMVRAWAGHWLGSDAATLKRVFGSESDKDKNFQVGSVVFLDAIPHYPVGLKVDVMTPHYGQYYQDDSGQTPPADWHSPVPVPFLVVEEGATFLFGIMPRRKNEEDEKDCERVKAWLSEALEWLGAGAKTAVGYGRFKDPAQPAGAQGTMPETTSLEGASPTTELVEGLRRVRGKEVKARAQGFVDKLKRLDAAESEKRQAATEMKAILERAQISKLGKLNAYKELCEIIDE